MLALTVNNPNAGLDNSQVRTSLFGTGVLTGSYAAGGEAITWTALTNAAGFPVLINSKKPTTPLWVEFQIAIPGATPLWFLPNYDYSTGKLQFGATGAAAGDGFGELAAGAYPADLTGATLYWKAEFSKD